jgi:hypothetical protein
MLCIVNKVIPAKAGAFRYPGALFPGVIEQLLILALGKLLCRSVLIICGNIRVK